jgi:hypothetical protein
VNFIAWMQAHRRSVLFLLALLVVGGFAAAWSLPVALFPHVEFPRIVVSLDAGDRPEVRVDVVGPLCESGDFLALDRALPHPRRGDLIAVGAAGAYGRVMSSTYNARPLCAEVVLEAGTWRVTRERGSYDDLIRNERA